MATVQEALQRVWSDDKFKSNLIKNPKPVLAELGLKLDPGVDVEIHENTPKLMNFVLPKKSDIPPGVDIEQADPVVGKVVKKAWADAGFKSKLLSNPKSAVAEASGVKLPDTLTVKVYEDSPTLRHLIIPLNPANEELSDMELETVAGGALSKGVQTAGGCGIAGAAMGTASGVMTALGFTAVTLGIGIGLGVGAGTAAAGSAAGGMVASGSGKC
jgi:hypothetical protein